MRRGRAVTRNFELAALATATAWIVNRIPVFSEDAKTVHPSDILKTLPGYDEGTDGPR